MNPNISSEIARIIQEVRQAKESDDGCGAFQTLRDVDHLTSELKDALELAGPNYSAMLEELSNHEDFSANSRWIRLLRTDQIAQRAQKIAQLLSGPTEENAKISNKRGHETSSPKVFVSHCSKDALLASALVKLLSSSTCIRPEEIRCTSVEGHTLATGAMTDFHLRREAVNSACFIALLTPASLQSVYVIFELGARWGADKCLMPVVSNGLNKGGLPKPLDSINAKSGTSRSDVLDLIQDVCSALSIEPYKSSSWDAQIDQFISVASISTIETNIAEVGDADECAQELISDFGDKEKSLTSLLPRVVAFAKYVHDEDLESFARHQLRGRENEEFDPDDPPPWIKCRLVKTWISIDGAINPSFMGFNGSISAMRTHIETSDRFKKVTNLIPDAISWIEEKASEADPNTMLTGVIPLSSLTGKSQDADTECHSYMTWDAYKNICDLIRSNMVSMLSKHL